ncbi:hypothetical protein [Rhodoferax mekongensis]|uniref:Co-chaperone DjlA N-terminal domain-containing protein n=1 Tax=Rhodoferax mekongensis TaxID=3068341 RepID=A0ABZ0AWY0_9BURK|nr:hypothetical protein [Rhodoferax sp. TBRC 17307]WNO04015.1 hypothetical protein RAN89_14000 [Rhodoferax sp. TBRC 17307]
MSDAWFGFLGGVLATLVGALIASIVQRHHEFNKRKQEAHVDAYFHLLDLHNWYFWVASAELRGESPPGEVVSHCRELALKLNDKLRTFDNVKKIEEILMILFSETMTANERANRLQALLDNYGQTVSPKHLEAMKRIGMENILRYGLGEAPKNNAPGSWR